MQVTSSPKRVLCKQGVGGSSPLVSTRTVLLELARCATFTHHPSREIGSPVGNCHVRVHRHRGLDPPPSRTGDYYVDVLAEHRRILRESATAHGGVEVDTQGDAFFFAFARARDAVEAARIAQAALAVSAIRVRMGIHTGQPILTGEGYVGLDVHRGARIAAAGHGDQVLLSETTRHLIHAAVRDLGYHRLKDLQAPEHIYQLGDAEFPPLRTLNQTNLPVQPTPFLGRDRELTEVVGLLRREDVRFVTLTGPGGSGKTRLGLQAAAEVVEDYLDGVWFVGLAALTDPALVLPTIAQTLGVRESGSATYADALAEHLRTKRMLLVLDNLEQLLPDASRPLGELVATAPMVDVVTSSRERLHLSVEHEFPVPPLTLDEAISLFAERARAIRPGFVVDGSRPRGGRGHLQPCGPTPPRDRARGRAHQGTVAGADPRSARSTVVAAHDRCRGCAGASADAPGDDRMEL